jgi:hypothetical protein
MAAIRSWRDLAFPGGTPDLPSSAWSAFGSCCCQGSNDDKNVIVEVRAEPAEMRPGCFRSDLLRMYSRWAETHGYK